VVGLFFPRHHPSILFGDGGAGKSYTALFIAGNLARQGIPVAFFDWELCLEDQRSRLEAIFGQDMPRILYCRCEQSLNAEADRLRRIVREHKVEYAIYDSIALACEGEAELSET